MAGTTPVEPNPGEFCPRKKNRDIGLGLLIPGAVLLLIGIIVLALLGSGAYKVGIRRVYDSETVAALLNSKGNTAGWGTFLFIVGLIFIIFGSLFYTNQLSDCNQACRDAMCPAQRQAAARFARNF